MVSWYGTHSPKHLLYPGNKVCNACHVAAGDDRMMIRTLVNMLVWNLAIVLIGVAG